MKKFFIDLKSNLLEDAKYRLTNEDDRKTLEETIHDEIDSLQFDLENVLNLIHQSISDKSMTFYEILKAKDKTQRATMMEDLYARFIFMIIQIMILDYKSLMKKNFVETSEWCKSYFMQKYSNHIENKFIHDFKFGTTDFHNSMQELKKCVNISLCHQNPGLDGSICKEQSDKFQNEIVSYISILIKT